MSWPDTATVEDMAYSVVLDDNTAVHGRWDCDYWFMIAVDADGQPVELTPAQRDEAERRLKAADDAERGAWLEDQAELNAAYRRGW